MEAKEERLVARLRHHNPTLTVTELHIGLVDRVKKTLVIDYLHSLRLNPNVESSPGLETVVSVDISSSTEQDDIFKKLLGFIHDLGIGDVSISSEPFDERQPEIESTDSIPALDSSSRDYTPLNSQDIEELISRDKSDSEFELILSRPRRGSSRDSSSHSGQSSKDVIGSILRVSEDRSQNSGWSLIQHSLLTGSSKSLHPKHTKIQSFWSRTKQLFKRKRKQALGQFKVTVSKESIQKEIENSKDNGKLKGCNILRDIKPNQVSLNTLQKRLEKVSRDVFSMKNKCPGMKSDDHPLDVYTQTLDKDAEEANSKNTKTQTGADTHIRKYFVGQSSQFHPNKKFGSETSVFSDSSQSDSQVSGMQVAPQSLRGMVTNLIPLYPSGPADLKRPIMCELKPVGGPFFFRRISSTITSSHSTATSCLTTTASDSFKSTLTYSSLSVPTTTKEPIEDFVRKSASLENVVYTHSGHQYVRCGVVSTRNETPFNRERIKKTQTINPLLKATEINTSQVFKLPKVTQTKPRKRKKTPTTDQKGFTIGTQTLSCSSSTSCTELIRKMSCGTKTENQVEKVDKENSCYLLTKKATETKETNSEAIAMKCDTCQGALDKQVDKKKKLSGRQRKRGVSWGQYPDGNFGFGQSYAPGKVYPVISLATGFSHGNPFTLPSTIDKEENAPCPKLCSLFGGKKRALMEELNKQKMELMQMRMVLVAINEELLAECTDTSSEEYVPSSDDPDPSSDSQPQHKQNKKVTFRDPLVNESTLNYANY